MARKIAILGGTGPEGAGLANRLARAGEHIVIGSRDAGRAQETAQQLRNQIGGAAQIEGADNAAAAAQCEVAVLTLPFSDRKSTRLNSSHANISYAVFCLKKKKKKKQNPIT